jgi:hypothetical protein
VAASRVACDLGAVLRVVGGPVHDRHREVEFQEAAIRVVSQRQVVFVRGVRSQVAGSVDCLRWVDCPFQAWPAAARRSVDDSSKSPPLRHLRVWYSDDQG